MTDEKTPNPENVPDTTNIALWGTTGSGKTWLLNAFGKELSWYNENDPDFEYSLKDIDNNYLLYNETLNAIDVPATPGSEDYVWLFERRGKLKNSRAHQVSSHAHKILVHDNSGSSLVNAVKNEEDNEVVFSVLQNSTNVIILLDPTNVKGTPVAGATSNTLTKADYERLMGMLVEILLRKHSKIRLAICLSKSDMVKIHLTTEEIIRIVFGDGVMRALSSPRVEKAFFRVSSVGVHRKGGKRMSNLVDNEKIADPDKWSPMNVVAPFFWLFESIESERIKKGDFWGGRDKIYVSYPPPREG